MYIPHQNHWNDHEAILAFMRSNSFAALVSSDESGLVATHLPFVIGCRGDDIFLQSHMARANSQWKGFAADSQTLTIFSGAHAYISPDHYNSRESVPTWNYVAVHAYGTPRLLDDAETRLVLEAMFDSFQPSYHTHYGELSDDYKRKMINGIVAFEIKVLRLEAKHKLSQNKTAEERARIARALLAHGDPPAAEIGRLMMDLQS